jgi:hypothetical protein
MGKIQKGIATTRKSENFKRRLEIKQDKPNRNKHA